MSTALPTDVARLTTSPTARREGWRSFVADWLRVGCATLVCQAVGVVTSLLLRCLVDPAQIGIWQMLKLALSYGNYASFGVSKAAAREWSIAQGSGDLAGARRDLNVAFTVNLLTSLMYGILLAIAGWWLYQRGGTYAAAWGIGLAAVGLMSLVQRLVTFQISLLRAQGDFRSTTRVAYLEAVVGLLAGGLGAALAGIYGLVTATLLVLIGSGIYLQKSGAPRCHMAWDHGRMRNLASMGWPMLASGALWSLLQSLDKLAILARLPETEYQLGCYSLALLVSGQLFGAGNMLATVVAPRMGKAYGACGQADAPARLVMRALCWQTAVLGLLGGLATVAAPTLLGTMLPDYQDGLAAIAWATPGAVLLGISLPISQFLVAIRRERQAMLLLLAGCGLVATCHVVAAARGAGLAEVACANTIGYAGYLALLFHLGLRHHWRADAAAGLAIVALLLAVVPMSLAALLEASAALSDGAGLILKLLLVAAAWLAGMLAASRFRAAYCLATS